MAKYIFNKDYETQIRASLEGNPSATGTKQIKIPSGTKVDAELISPDPTVKMSSRLFSVNYNGINLSVDGSYLTVENGYDGSGINPNGMYTAKDDNQGTVAVKTNDTPKGSTKKVSTSIFTTKNVFIGLLVIGGTIYFLKYKNII